MPFEKGNKLAQEWTPENAIERFEDALEYAETDDRCLCLQDAIYYSGIPYSTFDYLADTQDVLGTIKDNIRKAVIRRINRFALEREKPSSAAASIWRMKQLGEKDEQTINQNQKTEVIVNSEKGKKTIDELFEKLD